LFHKDQQFISNNVYQPVQTKNCTYFSIQDSYGDMIFINLFSGLVKIGGLFSLIWELSNADERIRTTSAWVLDKANQNSVRVQNQVQSA
jgi:hypothetical protein